MIKRPDHYTRIAIVLHWVIALLLIGQYIGGRLMVSLDRGAFVYELFQLHKSFGFVILFLSILRLAWRVTHKAPALPE
ncbi:MAG: cytochrome b, partial [Maricaulaceae bacterium]